MVGRKGTPVTSTKWNNISYYGKKLKRDFTHIDKLIYKIDIAEGTVIDPQIIDTIIKMMRQKTNIASQITKMVNEIDTANRLENIEKILLAISPEALAEAKLKVGI